MDKPALYKMCGAKLKEPQICPVRYKTEGLSLKTALFDVTGMQLTGGQDVEESGMESLDEALRALIVPLHLAVIHGSFWSGSRSTKGRAAAREA